MLSYRFTCDRCNQAGTAVDNILPEGWEYIGVKDACNKCASLYHKIVADHEQDIKNFWEGK